MSHKTDLAGRVVVITGASSGIGRATALAFAGQGARLVLAARREEPLEEAARECDALGGVAIAVPTDVSVERDVQRLAQAALDRFGQIDIWVNNAAVSAFGRFEDTPSDVFRQIVETTLFGYAYGARAVLPVFRRQGGGTLVVLDSMSSRVPHPYASAYLAAKGGVHAMFESIRMELLNDGEKDIHICSVLPGVIDTPFYQHVANFTGLEVKAMRPVYKPEEVADAVVSLAITPRRETIVGVQPLTMVGAHGVAPRTADDKVSPPAGERGFFTDRPAPLSNGNLFEPTEPHTVDGGWNGKASGSGLRRAAVYGAAAAGLAYLAWQRRTPDDVA